MEQKVNRRRGFTLVEVIVVLVILAILAAILIPSLSGYIDKARRNSLILECRSCVTAAQTLLTVAYADDRELMPDTDVVLALAEAPGEVLDIEIDDSPVRINHLSYTRNNIIVTYCATFSQCASHDQTYNFDEYSGGGGADSGGGDQSGSGDTTIANTVTLTDSDGNEHVLAVSGNWEDIKSQITSSAGWNIVSGTILSDETGIYICCNWSQWAHYTGSEPLTLEKMAAERPGDFMKLDSDNRILSDGDIENVNGSVRWKTTPNKGDICYYKGKYYIAPNQIGLWTLPPGGWISVPQ